MADFFKKDLKKYLKHWLALFIFAGVIIALFVAFYISRKHAKENAENSFYKSTNTERVYGDRRVFDYADQLTDSQEAQLEAYIHEKEKETMTDIVIVTLNQSLADYAPEYRAKYSTPITPDKYVMVYGDKFWEDNRFGYDAPQRLDNTTETGDGVLLVDNLFREPETRKIYTWMCTTGIVEDTFSDSMIDDTLDSFYNYVEEDYYKACIEFIDTYVYYMKQDISVPRLGHILPYIVAIIIFLSYVFTNRKERLGKVTTTPQTYIIGNTLNFTENKDVFLKKNVSRRYNPPSSSSSGGGGGGGHHTSGGGGSHGGGGHSR